MIDSLILSLAFLFLSVAAHQTLAADDLICDDDTAQIASQHEKGRLVTQRVMSVACDTNYGLKFSEPARDSATKVCEPSQIAHIPEGFVLIKREACSENVNGFIIQLPNAKGETRICEGTFIPEGFIVTGNKQHIDCALSGSGLAFTIEPDQGDDKYLCDNETVLPGYVIIAITEQDAHCQGQARYTVEQATGSNAFICEGSLIPNGWAITNIPIGFRVLGRRQLCEWHEHR